MKNILISDFNDIDFQNMFKSYFGELGLKAKNKDDVFVKALR